MITLFQNLADFTHLSSKLVLLWAIHRNRSAEGVSLLTQILYLGVFITRYLDLFQVAAVYLVFFKIFFIISSIYTIFIMMKVYPRTRERERAWKLAVVSVVGSLILSPIMILIYSGGFKSIWFIDAMWVFSRILESVCILPQLLLLRQTTVPTVINSYYMLALGLYRVFYILHWILKAVIIKQAEPVTIIFGLIQTAFYLDFAWVYYTRQRVKLRNGGVVDSEDYRNSWLLNRVFTFRQRRSEDDEEQRLHDEDAGDGGNEQRSVNNRWGERGISISADDTLENHGLRDPDGFLEDDDSSEDQTHDQRAHRHSPSV